MLISEYDAFVKKTDQSIGRPREDQLDIARYGLVAEIGSVVSAIKKKLLGEASGGVWNCPNEEIVEELGDVMWYCFSLARIANPDRPVNIFAHDIARLKTQISSKDEAARKISRQLDPSKRSEFLEAAEKFPKRTKALEFEDYQSLAILTARTKDKTLAGVCLAVLLQLSAQLFRAKLPSSEREINKDVADEPVNDVLGEIAWHVSALASIFELSLSDVAEKNVDKASSRWAPDSKKLHDEGFPEAEKLPRQFEVAFVTVEQGRSRMYVDGRRLGDELTDNAYEDDGYRYHDVMHLANAAKLGWSPVLRNLMKRKRKSDAKKDEVEDGARAQIVEEAVIKAIHSEGERIASFRAAERGDEPVPLFQSSADISFRFLKLIQNMVKPLEVYGNSLGDWEAAILAGFQIYHKLRCEQQGTVKVDLEQGTLEFRPEVYVDLDGQVAGLGTAYIRAEDINVTWNEGEVSGRELGIYLGNQDELVRLVAQKRAILRSLEILNPAQQDFQDLEVIDVTGGQRISVKAKGGVQKAMWKRRVVSFRTSSIVLGPGFHCTAIAMTDK